MGRLLISPHPTGTRRSPLGRHGLEVGPLALGCAAAGNLYEAVPDDVWQGVVPAAWAAGIRYFDVAPHYGLGLAERRLGAALDGRPRDELVISTKVGRVLRPRPNPAGDRDAGMFDVPADYERVLDYTRDGVLRSLEASLQRLGVDRVDILFVHDPDDYYAAALDEVFPTLEELRGQGVIRSYGAGMNQSAMLARFVERTDLDIVMLAGRYTLLEQGALADLLPLCLARDVSVVAAGVFNSGILAMDRPDRSAHYNYETVDPDVLSRAVQIADVCARHDVPLPAAAMAFVSAHPAVRTLCLGVRTAEQVQRNIDLLAREVPSELWAELLALGLIDAAAPVPE